MVAVARMSIDGILNVNKPKGNTSYDIVAWLKRRSGEKHIGHAGTLDPGATGVLPVCFGRATKVVQFLMNFTKTYRTEIRLGVTTDTHDSEGKVLKQDTIDSITRGKVEEVLASFRGIIKQTPPAYSALKDRGRRCYQLARAGIPVRVKVRQVEIFSIALVEWSPPLLTIVVECGKGTYIRSLAHELGQLLGCGACVTSLSRLNYGPFGIDEALSMAEIENAFENGSWTELLYPVDTVFLTWPVIIVDEKQELIVRNGCPLTLSGELAPSSEYCRVYSSNGDFIAILRFASDSHVWCPVKVFVC